MAYIIGTYNKYDTWDRAHSLYKFEINGNWYAIKEVEMVWGQPALSYKIDQDDDPSAYFIFEQYDAALEYVKRQKSLNR